MAVVDEERAELLNGNQVVDPETQGCCKRTLGDPLTLVVDILASIPFYYVMFWVPLPDKIFYFLDWTHLDSIRYVGLSMDCCCVLAIMVLWRVFRAYVPLKTEDSDELVLPYTCGVVKANGKSMFLVATIHISPKSPLDVEEVIEKSTPDTVMIELDDERLDRMRADEPKVKKAKEEDLQSLQISLAGKDPYTIYAQRAMWNGEMAGQQINGQIVHDKTNIYGLEQSNTNVQGKVSLVQRGGPEGEFAPFAYKAHIAARSGAEAVLIMSKDDNLPLSRIGGSASAWGDVKVAFKTHSCGFPPIPCVLLTKTDSEELTKAIEDGSSVNAKLEVRADHYPRRTLRRRLCQACALIFSGIGILYGIIQCFAVEVGGEFLAAEIAANAKGIPCVCVDSNLNQFWTKLGEALIPTPCNILDSFLSWLAFPRIAFQVLFPPRQNVDVAGSIVLHAKSFSPRTWVAFVLAGFCASQVTSHVMALFTNGAERVVEQTGAVKKEDREAMQTWIALFVQLYMLPQVYGAVAASRDEVMYRSIVAKGRENASSRMVVVVGAGHANGIMQRARTRGL